MRIANSRTTQLFSLLILLIGLSPAVAQDSSPVLLKGATIHPMDGQDAFVGSVLIVDGKIKSVGKSIKAPKKAKTIDLKGYQLTPGLIDSRSKLWLNGSSINDRGTRADLEVEFAIDPWSKDWQEVASQGITSVYVQPASGGTLGGYGSVLRVGPFDSVEEIVLKSKVGIQASLGLTGNSQTRHAQVKALEKLLETAKKELDKEKAADKPPTPRKATDKDKKDAKEDKKEDKKDGEKKIVKKAEVKKDDKKDEKKDDKKEDEKKKVKDTVKTALKRVLKREVPMHIEVRHSDTLAMVLKLAEKYKFRLVLDGLSQVDSAADQLCASDRPMVIGPFVEPAVASFANVNTRNWFADEACEDGRLWSLSGFPTTGGIESRMLRCQAAMAIRHGASHKTVLAAVTINPARMLGIADQVGSIEAGKLANISVFAGDPLDPSSPVRMVICDGKVTHDADHAAMAIANKAKKLTKDVLDALPAKLPSNYAIKSTRILLSSGKLESGHISVNNGQAKFSQGLPQTSVLFDLGDKVITPGLVNAWSTLNQQATIWDTLESDSSHIRSIDGIDPTTEVAQAMLAGGVIHIGVAPSPSNTSSGVAGHLRLGSSDFIGNPTTAGQFVFSQSARSVERYPYTLGSQVSMLDSLFDGGSVDSNIFLATTVANAIAKEKQENLDALKGGGRSSILLANSKVEIRSALKFAKTHKLKGAIAGGQQLGEFADEIKAQGLGVVVALKAGMFDEAIEQFVTLDKAGVPLAIYGNTPADVRMTATLLVNAGVSQESAMQALTNGGAALVGIDGIGFGEGNHADFVVWDGNPLNLASKPVHVLVDGKHVSKK